MREASMSTLEIIVKKPSIDLHVICVYTHSKIN